MNRLYTIIIVTIIAISLSGIAYGQETADVCSSVRYLMEREITPYDLTIGGGTIQPNQPYDSTFAEDYYADVWSFLVIRPNIDTETILSITFDAITLGLEIQVFDGMDALADGDFIPIENNQTYSFSIPSDGTYTLIVRRRDVSIQTAGNYSFTADFPGGGDIVSTRLRDNTTNLLQPAPPAVESGQFAVEINNTTVFTHPNVVNSVSSFNGSAAQVRFETITSGILVNNWVNTMHLLGGDLAVTGSRNDTARIFYLKDYGYDIDMQDSNLLNVTDSNGTHWQLSWDVVHGIWADETCAAMKLLNGQTFVGELKGDIRDFTFAGTLDDFRIRLSPSKAINMSWATFDPSSTIELLDGQLHAVLNNQKVINLDSSQIDIRPAEGDGLYAIELIDRGASIVLDWMNIIRLDVIDDRLEMWFLDEPRSHTVRSSKDLLSLEGIDDVIRIIYKDPNDDGLGEQHLLLPASEDYIELVTPAGMPPFDGHSLPNEEGYAPRSLNNTGGECYPINTMLENITNCPPNGHPNPANGNLWYAVTDLSAMGNLIDLNLTRSYNSRLSQVDGPFGLGWATPYLIDYNVTLNETTHSRIIDPSIVAAYPVSLDLTWAPRGIVTLQTGSGSQHTFVTQSNNFTNGTLMAITMPNWTLSRDDLRASIWSLKQDNNMTYRFDRAGRLIDFGMDGRVISIDYPNDTGSPVIITDAIALRQLELYYDAQQHVVRSILRDNTVQGDISTCTREANCHETQYTYDAQGYLVAVQYADGTNASYTYDDLGRLIQHQDPRAPIAADMQYTYGEDGSLRIEVLEDGISSLAWRELEAPIIDGQERTVSVINEYDSRNTYTYAWTAGSPKSAQDTFNLISEISPLDGTTEFESMPIVYTWEDGILQTRQARSVGNAKGRNSLVLEYVGNRFAIGNAYPEFSINYQSVASESLPQSISFADSTSMSFTYDERGWVQSMTDKNGAIYSYTWNDNHQLIRELRENDQTATDYTYNEAGLVTSITYGRVNDTSDLWYTIDLAYDGLGQLVSANHPTSGRFTIVYDFEVTQSTVSVTDVTGTQTISNFDTQRRLVAQRIMTSDNQILRHDTYKYDAIGRIVAETNWLYPSSIDSFTEPQAHTTTYTYQRLETLSEQPGDEGDTVINGYQITVTDPHGRRTYYTYDGRNRIRQEEHFTGEITRYVYSVGDADSVNGIHITQRDILNNDLTETTHYDFNLHWQLELVTTDDATWDFARENNRLSSLAAPQDGVAGLAWLPSIQGRPSGVNAVQVGLSLDSGQQLPSPSLEITYDFIGRPQQVTDDADNVYDVLYCSEAFGTQKVIYGHVNAADLTCENDMSEDIAYIFFYDAQQRITRIEGPNGVRTYTYTPLPDAWQIDITSDGYSWQLLYNGVGDLLSWVDENGITHEYEYDTLGHLREVTVENQPEASFTFYYNEIGLLLSQLDELRRGTRYVYDELGRLVVEQDARTANATIYGYNASGQLSTIISPLGRTTSLLYEDISDPTRLTGIIDPSGATSRFEWNDRSNKLVFVDPRGNETTYTFDSFDDLWRIEDTLGRTHEIHYDALGNLTNWRQSQSQNATPAKHLQVDWLSPLSFTVTETRTDWSRQFVTNANHQITQVSDTSGNVINYFYDEKGRLNHLFTLQQRWSITHQSGNPEIIMTDSYGVTRTMSFDALNRLTLDGTTSYTYEQGRNASVNLTVADSATRVYTYETGDDSSRPPSIVEKTPGKQTTYIFNAEGHLDEVITETCITSPVSELDNCIQTGEDIFRTSDRLVYDAQGRPARHIDTEQNIETFAYDDAGNLSIYQDANGKTFNYDYDAFNRLLSVTSPTGIQILLDYDVLDRVTGICRTRAENRHTYQHCANDGNVIESYSYDRLGRITTQTFPTNDSVQYTYDGDMLVSWGVDGTDEQVAFTYNNLGQVESLTTNQDEYNFAYSTFVQLSQSGALSYTYDDLGRLTSVQSGGNTLRYDYAPNNQGYTITDETSGKQIAFILNERGMLAGIETGAEIDYFLNPDGRILIVQIQRDDGELIEIQLDRLGETQSVAYSAGNLFLNYTTNEIGQVQRQRITGLSDYFEADAKGYISVIGYDDDNRPLTMRITERESGQILYLLTITYDEFGQPETETRQFTDGTQITISYRYEDNQLVRRQISVKSKATQALINGSPVLFILMLAGWVFRLFTQKRLFFTVIMLSVMIPLFIIFSGAQPNTNTVSLDYEYDAAGNIIEIASQGTTCVTYHYDNANRLTSVEQDEDVVQSYAYDAQNRLARIGDQHILYQGDSYTILSINNSSPQYYAQPASSPTLFRLGDEMVWFTHDGLQNILSASNSTDSSIWLFDPMGRFFSIQASVESILSDPCTTLASPLTTQMPPLHNFQNGAIWDTKADLYFIEGRAYSPEIRQFLQRDWYGPDVFGNVYAYPSRQTVIPVRTQAPHYTTGLFKLRDTLETIAHTKTLTASHIVTSFMPSLHLQQPEPLTTSLHQVKSSTQHQLLNHLDLPVWLNTQYNLPAPYIADDGSVQLMPDNAPGHGGTNQPMQSTSDHWIHPLEHISIGIDTPLSRLGNIVNHSSPSLVSVTLYQPNKWQPHQPSFLQEVQRPQFDNTPSAVYAHLPHNLSNPLKGANVLDVIMMLNTLPNQTSADIVSTTLDYTLPTTPTLPLDTDGVLSEWFTDDIFGITSILQNRIPDLPEVSIPIYDLGVNHN